MTEEETEGVDEGHIRKGHTDSGRGFGADMSHKSSVDDVI